jgi:Fe-S oxidoreductase
MHTTNITPEQLEELRKQARQLIPVVHLCQTCKQKFIKKYPYIRVATQTYPRVKYCSQKCRENRL